jgi:hypothetical protein
MIKTEKTFIAGGNNDTISFDSIGEGLKEHPADFLAQEQRLIPGVVSNEDLFTTDANKAQIT